MNLIVIYIRERIVHQFAHAHHCLINAILLSTIAVTGLYSRNSNAFAQTTAPTTQPAEPAIAPIIVYAGGPSDQDTPGQSPWAAVDEKETNRTKLLGTKGTAAKIVYLCDASGSMSGIFPVLKRQLKSSVNALDQSQQFNIIFFSDDNIFPLFRDSPQSAVADNKHKAMEFIDNAVATGATQPMPAIKFALAEKAEMTYVLTDGFDQAAHLDEIANAFKRGNPDGKIQINCIFFQSSENPKLIAVLKQIVKDSHGELKIILKSDIN
jgi:hypothetical protein